MITSLPDAMNAEIVLGTISNLKDAVNWLTYTYLYVRMLKNPNLYGITNDEISNDNYLLQRRTDLAHTSAIILDKHGLIKYEKKTGNFLVTHLGRVASHYYIKYPSISVYNDNLKPYNGMIDLFRIFSFSSEFKQIPIREEEKQEIAKLMVKVPIPIKGSIEEPASKINILLQSYISQFKIDGYAISSDMVYISQSAGRIMRALFEICSKRGWAQLSLTILNVCKMIEKRIWSTMTPLRQFKIIPEDTLYKIERKEQLTWDRFYDMTPEQIGELIRMPRQGKAIHRLVHTFPRLDLEAVIQPLTRSCILVELIIAADFIWDERFHGSSELFHIFVEDCDSEIILHNEIFVLKKKNAEKDHRLSFIVPMIEPKPPQYFIRVVSEKWLNCERLLPISFKHTILPEKFPPHTGLLDLQPLLFSALKNQKLEKIYTKELNYTQMLPIQTQSFKNIFETDDSILIGATTGSGKTLCAELAIHRYLKSTENKIKPAAIYVSSIKSLVKDKYNEWTTKFSSLNYKIGFLTGQFSLDYKIFTNSDIVMCTPDTLDQLTRKWVKNEKIRDISLVIIDEIHLIGESGGVLEVCLSRLRYMANNADKNIRFIALGTSLANPNNLADWLGIKQNNIFNFNPNVRNNKLEIYIQGFDQVDRKMRLIAMAKPIYNSIKTHAITNILDKKSGKVSKAIKKPVMIYSSDRKQARLIALDLLLFSATDDDPKKFLLVSSSEFDEILDDILDPTLKHILRFGVGYIHDGLTNLEKNIVKELYKKGAIQVLILTHNVCWEINLFCHLVIIVDPIKYDGIEQRWNDYSIPDLLQIMGRASLTIEKDPLRKCMLLCSSSKKEFYKKFLFDSFPLESHLNHFLHDHINAEINSTVIESKQDCLDWLTWTYMYRRLLQNPNYYDLQGKTKEHLNDYLSELVERTLSDLQKSNCININASDSSVESLVPLNYGKIASFYYVKYNTIDLFSQSLSESTKKISDLINILCNAYEFEEVSIRNGEDDILFSLAKNCGMDELIKQQSFFNEPHCKANILLNCYFHRQPIPSDMLSDQKQIIEIAYRLSCAFVDILSTNGILKQSILSMELSQMIIQAMWIKNSTLLQLPHFDNEIIEICKKKDVNEISDFMNLEDNERNEIVNFTDKQLNEVAEVCNRYPFIDMKVNILNENEEVLIGKKIEFEIKLERDIEVNILPPINGGYFPCVN
jgi:pre-mRNA-splicing helicase BRR2